jgi:methionyl aminopeptidase
MIIRKSKDELARMREAGRIVAETLRLVAEAIRPGITTGELDQLAEAYIVKRGGKPAFKGYRGFPDSICTSVNEEVVHGIPGSRKLKSGDIVGVDVGVALGGYYGDAAETFAVGPVSAEVQRLITAAREALAAAIDKCRIGSRLSDVSHAIQVKAESAGFSVVREFVGHGIGRSMHEDPQIPNFGEAGKGPQLQVGMTFAVEPMITAGGYEVEVLEDGWSVVTKDGSLSAHFEHTVAVTQDRPEILTAL